MNRRAMALVLLRLLAVLCLAWAMAASMMEDSFSSSCSLSLSLPLDPGVRSSVAIAQSGLRRVMASLSNRQRLVSIRDTSTYSNSEAKQRIGTRPLILSQADREV